MFSHRAIRALFLAVQNDYTLVFYTKMQFCVMQDYEKSNMWEGEIETVAVELKQNKRMNN